MIFTERTITVVNDSATINKPLILYRGDKNIELKITIAESQFKFRNTDASNVIETTDASYAQLVINTPYNSPIFSDVAATKNGAVIFVITEAMIDEIREVGAYEIQIRLLDDNKQSRASIPPVSNAIEIREPIAIEDGSAVDSNVVNVAKVNRALTTTSAPLEVFDSQGNYIKKTWGDGDPITDAALNKMEAGIDGVNKKVANNSSQIKELFQDVSNGKTLVANAITDKGVDTLATDTFQTMATNISNISGGSSKVDIVYKTINDKLYREVFYDDFDNESLDKNYFVDRYLPSWTTKPLSKAKYDISDSVLSLKIEENQEAWCSADGTLRTCGIMTGVKDKMHRFNSSCTVKTNYETYWGLIARNGYFEVKCKGVNCSGMHTAWWLIGIQDQIYDDGRTQTAEIDVFEIMGNNDATKWRTNLLNVESSNITEITTVNSIDADMSADFHVWGMEWTTNNEGLSTLDFYIDGTKFKTITSTNLDYPLVQLFSMYEYPGGSWSGELDTTKPYPKTFDIDYIKLYKQAEVEVSDLRVTSIDPVNIELETNTYEVDDYGILAILPSYVTLNYNDGSRTENYVMWQRLNEDMKTKIEAGQQVIIKGNVANISNSIMNNVEVQATIIVPEIPVYSITYTLENTTSSNSEATIQQGQSYSCTLTPSEGYSINRVIVTMNGVDITSTAYSNGTITINNVTGNIVINAQSATYTINESAKVFHIDSSCYNESNVTLIDSVSNISATLNGTPILSGDYIKFTADNYFEFDISSLALSGSFTLKIKFMNGAYNWMKKSVLMLGSSTDVNSHGIAVQYDQLLTYHKNATLSDEVYMLGQNATSGGQLSTTSLSANTEYEVVMSYNADTNLYKEYFNGALSYSATASFPSQNSLVKLFNSFRQNNHYGFEGGYKEISIYNKAID